MRLLLLFLLLVSLSMTAQNINQRPSFLTLDLADKSLISLYSVEAGYHNRTFFRTMRGHSIGFLEDSTGYLFFNHANPHNADFSIGYISKYKLIKLRTLSEHTDKGCYRFLWHYRNSYDSDTGTAKVSLTIWTHRPRQHIEAYADIRIRVPRNKHHGQKRYTLGYSARFVRMPEPEAATYKP